MYERWWGSWSSVFIGKDKLLVRMKWMTFAHHFQSLYLFGHDKEDRLYSGTNPKLESSSLYNDFKVRILGELLDRPRLSRNERSLSRLTVGTGTCYGNNKVWVKKIMKLYLVFLSNVEIRVVLCFMSRVILTWPFSIPSKKILMGHWVVKIRFLKWRFFTFGYKCFWMHSYQYRRNKYYRLGPLSGP